MRVPPRLREVVHPTATHARTLHRVSFFALAVSVATPREHKCRDFDGAIG
jgi:hypothetical protein